MKRAPRKPTSRPYPVVYIAADGTETTVTIVAPSARAAVEAAHAAQRAREMAGGVP